MSGGRPALGSRGARARTPEPAAWTRVCCARRRSSGRGSGCAERNWWRTPRPTRRTSERLQSPSGSRVAPRVPHRRREAGDGAGDGCPRQEARGARTRARAGGDSRPPAARQRSEARPRASAEGPGPRRRGVRPPREVGRAGRVRCRPRRRPARRGAGEEARGCSPCWPFARRSRPSPPRRRGAGGSRALGPPGAPPNPCRRSPPSPGCHRSAARRWSECRVPRAQRRPSWQRCRRCPRGRPVRRH